MSHTNFVVFVCLFFSNSRRKPGLQLVFEISPFLFRNVRCKEGNLEIGLLEFVLIHNNLALEQALAKKTNILQTLTVKLVS